MYKPRLCAHRHAGGLSRLGFCVLLLTLLPALATRAAPSPPATPVAADTVSVDDDPMHHGAGTSYMVGRSLLDGGDAESALPYLGQAYRLEPGIPEFGEAFIEALLRQGYGSEALRVNRELLAARPGDFGLGERQVFILTGLELHDEALAALAALRVAHPDSSQLILLQAEVQSRARRGDDALSSYREALELRPQDREDIYLAMCRLAARADRGELLAALWGEALTALPGSRMIRLGALQHLVEAGRFERAVTVAAAGDSLRASGDDPEAAGLAWNQLLAELLERAGRYALGAELLRSDAGSGGLDRDGTLLLARLEAGAGDQVAAILALRSAASRWPDDPLVRLDLGRLLADTGDLGGGEAELRRALALAPNQPAIPLALISILLRRHPDELQPGGGAPLTALHEEVAALAADAAIMLGDDYPRSNMLLGFAFHAAGRLEEAGEQYKIATREPALERDAMLSLSFVYEEMRDVDRLLGVLELLLSAHPDDAEIQNAMGYALADADRELPRAETLIRKALAQEPESGAYLDSLGWVLYRRGDFEGAFDQMVAAVNARPEDPVILEHMGRVLLALGRTERALTVLRRARDVGNDGLDDLIAELEGGP